MSVFQGAMEEELERNLRKQKAFEQELSEHPKGYLSVCRIEGIDYIYRKHREGARILSVYIGVPGSEQVKKAEEEREAYLLAKRSLSELKREEKRLRRAIKEYAGMQIEKPSSLKKVERLIESQSNGIEQ